VNCQICGNSKERLDSHHLIPRYLGGQREDIIQVCRSCHRKIEILFQNFLKWGSFDSERWKDDEEHWLNNTCEWCHKSGVRVSSHHLIPRYVNGNGDTVELCMSCHRRFEEYFWNFLWWGSFEAEEWQDPYKSRLRNQAYLKRYPTKQKEYYEKNKEKIKQRTKRYYENNKQKCLEKQREYYRKNRDRFKEYRKKWYQEHKEEDNRRVRNYYQEHRKELLAKQKEYYQGHREELLAYARKYREQKRGKEE
jgi:hypothetical protein